MGKKFGILLFLLMALCLPVSAEEAAVNISSLECLAESQGFPSPEILFDGNTRVGIPARDHSSLTLQDSRGIGSLYLVFTKNYGAFTLTDNDTGKTAQVGQEAYLHTFVSLEECFGKAPTSVTVSFDNGEVHLWELSVFTPGQVPDWVQRWDAPADGGADLVLFSTHADDEQLFFAGVLPYYAGELGYKVQVVYMTDHANYSDGRIRRQEALNGLWNVGVRCYPVFGSFADYYSTSLQGCYDLFRVMGVSDEELLSFTTEMLRRFRPLVAVCHDLKGEYGHGQHMLYTDLIIRASQIANDPSQFPGSAEQWGLWELPKMYIHLYKNNPIVMDWDQPLEHFGGMTAFQVTKELGFTCHISQKQGFAWYMNGVDRAADISQYSPCEYGLYQTTVGPDTGKQDFFENLTIYAQQEAKARLEDEARKAAEEEAQRQAAEARQAELQKAEAQRQAEQARLAEEDRLAQQEAARHRQLRVWAAVGAMALAVYAAGILLYSKRK